jgi:hypothetical protein
MNGFTFRPRKDRFYIKKLQNNLEHRDVNSEETGKTGQ